MPTREQGLGFAVQRAFEVTRRRLPEEPARREARKPSWIDTISRAIGLRPKAAPMPAWPGRGIRRHREPRPALVSDIERGLEGYTRRTNSMRTSLAGTRGTLSPTRSTGTTSTTRTRAPSKAILTRRVVKGAAQEVVRKTAETRARPSRTRLRDLEEATKTLKDAARSAPPREREKTAQIIQEAQRTAVSLKEGRPTMPDKGAPIGGGIGFPTREPDEQVPSVPPTGSGGSRGSRDPLHSRFGVTSTKAARDESTIAGRTAGPTFAKPTPQRVSPTLRSAGSRISGQTLAKDLAEQEAASDDNGDGGGSTGGGGSGGGGGGGGGGYFSSGGGGGGYSDDTYADEDLWEDYDEIGGGGGGAIEELPDDLEVEEQLAAGENRVVAWVKENPWKAAAAAAAVGYVGWRYYQSRQEQS